MFVYTFKSIEIGEAHMFHVDNWYSYYDTVADIIETDEVQSMRAIPHHIGMTCYEHSVFVSYIAFRMANKMSLDAKAAARGGLLHDFYLYSPEERSRLNGSHSFLHPKIALVNAMKLCEITDKEKNIILSHMWPLSRTMPKSREAVLVNCADKYCATAEAMRIWHRMKVRAYVPVVSTS